MSRCWLLQAQGFSAHQQAEGCARHPDSLLPYLFSFLIYFLSLFSFPPVCSARTVPGWLGFPAAINHSIKMLMDEPAQGEQPRCVNDGLEPCMPLPPPSLLPACANWGLLGQLRVPASLLLSPPIPCKDGKIATTEASLPFSAVTSSLQHRAQGYKMNQRQSRRSSGVLVSLNCW